MPLEGDALAAWLRERAGCLTASRMADAMAVLRPGKDGRAPPAAKQTDLIRAILAERLTGETIRTFVNDAMQWGIERQPAALSAYEAHTGALVEPTDEFVRHPRIEYFGATPDAYIGSDGLVEVKCPQTTTYVEWRLAGEVPAQHRPQMLAQLACTGRRWCEFVAFDPRVRGGLGAQLFIRRFEPTPDEISAVEAAAVEFLERVDRLWEILTSGGA